MSNKIIEWICRIIVVTIGSSMSPAWGMARQAMEPWVDWQRLNSVNTAAFEVLNFYSRMQAEKELISTTLIPKLWLCLMISILCMVLCNLLGKVIARVIIQKREQLKQNRPVASA